MLKEKNLVARYVVHFIGYGAYVIRNRNQVRDICGIVDFQRNSVEIQASDGPLLHTALSDISSFGNSIGRMPYRDYVLYLMARNQVGPYGINIHGVQLWSPRDMKYFAVNKAVDARFFKGRNWQNRQIPGSSISADTEEGFVIPYTILQEHCRASWDPHFALGGKCIQLERAACEKGSYPDLSLLNVA